MSSAAKKLLQIQAGAGEAVYVDDVFSTYLYEGNGTSDSSTNQIQNGLDLSGEGGLVWLKSETEALQESPIVYMILKEEYIPGLNLMQPTPKMLVQILPLFNLTLMDLQFKKIANYLIKTADLIFLGHSASNRGSLML